MAYPDGNRSAVATKNDHQAWLWVISILSLMYSTIILITRVIVKLGYTAHDDMVLGIAYLFSIAQWGCMYTALSHGLGKAAFLMSHGAVEYVGKLVFTSQVLSLIAFGLTKYSALVFIQNMFTRGNRTACLVCTVYGGVCLAWTFVAPMITSIGCSPSRSVDGRSSCPRNIYRWGVVVGVDCVLELGLIAIPAWLFAPVRMDRYKKTMVVVLFGFRFFGVLLFIAYIVSYSHYLHNPRTSIGIVEPLAWQQALLCSALISATMPVFKGFIRRFTTQDLVRIHQSEGGSGSQRLETNARRSARKGSVISLACLTTQDRLRRGNRDSMLLRPDGDEEGIGDVYGSDGRSQGK